MGHKKKHTKTERRGLPGGPNEMFTYFTGVFSTEGYKLGSPDFDNPFNVIKGDKDGTPITMDNVPFSILGMDNLGNNRIMYPNDDDYKFPGSRVFELPLRDTLELSNQLKDKKNIQLGVSTDFRNIKPRFSTVLPTQTEVDVRGVLPLQYFDNVLPFDVKSQNQGNIDVGINQPLSRNTDIGIDFNIPLKGNSNKKMDPVISFKHRFGKGGTVSWDWKGKSYSGTLIPSMETETNRYARTKNGKIKTLPKAQSGNFGTDVLSALTSPFYHPRAMEALEDGYDYLKHQFKKSLIPSPNMDGLSENKLTLPSQDLSEEEQLEALKNLQAQEQVINAKKFAGQWMSSPRYKEMLANSMAVSESDMGRERVDNFPLLQEEEKIDYDLPGTGIGGYSITRTGEVFVNPNSRFQETLYDHEFSHSIDRPGQEEDAPSFLQLHADPFNISKNLPAYLRSKVGVDTYREQDRLIPKQDQDLMYDLQENQSQRRIENNTPDYRPVQFWEDYGYDEEEGTRLYYTDPTEVRARLNEIRRGLHDNKVDVFNNKVQEGDVDKIKNKSAYKALEHYYGKDGVLKMLNEISMEEGDSNDNIQMAQQGGSVSEIWQNVTGTPWSQAKEQGLTDGSYAGNIDLRNQLISSPSKFKQQPSNTLPPANTNSNAGNSTLSPEEINDRINKAKDFNSAFKIARDYYGANKIFEYKAKPYGTNLQGETFEPSEEDMVAAGLKPQQKNKIYKQNRSVVSPYTDDNIVKFDEYEDFENVKQNNANVNRMDQADLIVSYQLANAKKPYLIVDENAGRMHLYYPGEEQPKESYPILSGSNVGDAQTVTKADYYYNGEKLDQAGLNEAMRLTGADSVDALMDMKGYSAKTNWDAGNKSTGAGKFTIGQVNEDSGFYDDSGQNRATPSFVLKNEDGNEVSSVIHTVPSKKSAARINALTAQDPTNMRMTNGCINGMCSDLIDMHNIHDIGEGSEIFILPEDQNNKFVYQNGKLNFRTTAENRQMYETYIDEEGNEQKGQGVNRTRNTLNYKPIKIDIDREAFENDKFTYFDFNDEKEYNNVVIPFAKSLEDNKQQVMKVMQVNGDAYNDIAKVAFGILGNETNFGDTHSAVGNFARGVNKYFDRTGSSSPDYISKYDTYGADKDENSAGLTQFRWKWVEKDAEQGGDLKERLKTLGITSNKDFLEADKAALGTVAILSYYYNNRKVDDIMQDLPKHWAGVLDKDPNRDIYTKGVADKSKYFTIKEKTFQKGGGINNDVLIKQAYAESTFRPKVTSSANAKGLTQIRPNVLGDYIKANNIEGDVDLTNVTNAVDVQKWYMNDLYNASFIDKEDQTDQVRVAKTLAAYNWGRGNLVDFLNEKKTDYDIYKSLDWVDKLPKETKDYVNKILGNNEKFNKDYNAAINNEKYTYILNEYKSIGGEISDLKVYRDYMNGMYDGKSNLKKAESVYDKLNRVYYHKAGQVGMSAPNYIMSYLDEASI